MTKYTPFYNPDVARGLYFRARSLWDEIDAQLMLPWGQRSSDNSANRQIVLRHRALVAKARELADELRAITVELAEHAREKEGG